MSDILKCVLILAATIIIASALLATWHPFSDGEITIIVSDNKAIEVSQ